MTMPQMRAAFSGWQNRITLVRITQTVVDGLVVLQESSVAFRGTIQPFGPKELALKSEGERAWEWLMIHTPKSVILNPEDRILIKGQRYKVMGQNNYQLNNFIEYHVVKDYQNG